MHALLACAALAAAALGVAAQQDVCNGAGGRPVLAVPGFTSSPLYDSANGYRRVFPLLVGENQDNDTLALPLEFEGLSQANDSLTPASGPNDDMPTLSGEAGLFLEELVRRRDARAHAFVTPAAAASRRRRRRARARCTSLRGTYVRHKAPPSTRARTHARRSGET